jgi:hypothetical protein
MDTAILSGAVLAAGVIIGGIVACVRGAIRAGQYLARSENAQTKIVDSNQAISDKLSLYMAEADRRFERIEGVQLAHSQEIAVLHDRTIRAQGRPLGEPA